MSTDVFGTSAPLSYNEMSHHQNFNFHSFNEPLKRDSALSNNCAKTTNRVIYDQYTHGMEILFSKSEIICRGAQVRQTKYSDFRVMLDK